MHPSQKPITHDTPSDRRAGEPIRKSAPLASVGAMSLAVLIAAGLGGAALAQPRPHEQLVVGMTSFPPSEHPYIDPLIVKSWVLGFASRQVTMFTPDWQNVCALCTEVPSLDNGRVTT